MSHAAAVVAALLLASCERESADTAAKKTAPSESEARQVADAQPATVPPLADASRWSAAEAAERLADPDPRVAVRAALRLLSMRDARPACIPDPLPAELAGRLRLERVGKRLFALGLRGESPRELRCPVLLTADGDVLDPIAGGEQAEAALFLTGGDSYPHLLMTPTRVWAVGFDKPLTPALVGVKLGGARFALRYEGDIPYVALEVQPGSDLATQRRSDQGQQSRPSPGGRSKERAARPRGPTREVARFVWDPYELSFMGPQRDRLPDPPGGFFVLDVDASELLTPVGGDVVDPNDPNQVVTDDPKLKLRIPPGFSAATQAATRASEPNEPNEPNAAEPNQPAAP